MKGKIITNIQFLRALAACIVVYYHCCGTAKINNISYWFKALGNWGHVGVDIFFVISGFIMVYIQSLKPKTPLKFTEDRFFRIVPIYWIITILYILLSLAIKHPIYINNILPKTIASFFFVVHFITDGSITNSDSMPVLTVGWTLEYEILFYLIFAISIKLKKVNNSIIFTGLVLIIFVLLGLTHTVCIDFILGMIICQIIKKYPKLKFDRNWIPLLIIVVFILSFNFIFKYETENNRFLLFGIPSTVIVFCSIIMPQMDNKILLYLGNASYSIYLTQMISISIGKRICEKMHLNSDIYILFLFTLSIIFGCLTYSYLEKPLSKLVKKILRNSTSL